MNGDENNLYFYHFFIKLCSVRYQNHVLLIVGENIIFFIFLTPFLHSQSTMRTILSAASFEITNKVSFIQI